MKLDLACNISGGLIVLLGRLPEPDLPSHVLRLEVALASNFGANIPA
jgi:hypothetical protein